MARRSKLTPEVQDKICEALRHCASYDAASEGAGISCGTFYRWMDESQMPQKKYSEFREAIRQAVADGQLNHLAEMEKVGRTDWRYHAWILERRHRKDFGATVDLTTGGEALTFIIERLEDGEENPHPALPDPG